MLTPVQPLQPVQRVQAAQRFEAFYTVEYGCIAGPLLPQSIEGEWVLDCDGNLTGSGWEPGHNCSITIVTKGAACPLEPSYP